MKVKFEKRYILIISKTLVYFFGFLGGVGSKAKGSAFFPIIFVKSEEFIKPWLVNHERIHFRQQLETLFIGSFLMTILERLYARIILGKTGFDSYVWGSGEQEAYLNQSNPGYLINRPFWHQFTYLKNKKKITLPSPGEIVLS